MTGVQTCALPICHIKSLIGVSADVQVLAPGAVPRSQGKAVRVRDLRPKAG